mmetsp:Transcript_107142/g.210038  ORF Transcript_107142/g.210038 Transcript_107142/m.210038 type:complete len:203 (+) Transcript_107142:640-1248(+)
MLLQHVDADGDPLWRIHRQPRLSKPPFASSELANDDVFPNVSSEFRLQRFACVIHVDFGPAAVESELQLRMRRLQAATPALGAARHQLQGNPDRCRLGHEEPGHEIQVHGNVHARPMVPRHKLRKCEEYLSLLQRHTVSLARHRLEVVDDVARFLEPVHERHSMHRPLKPEGHRPIVAFRIAQEWPYILGVFRRGHSLNAGA